VVLQVVLEDILLLEQLLDYLLMVAVQEQEGQVLRVAAEAVEVGVVLAVVVLVVLLLKGGSHLLLLD
jgi:hypothetical protein